MRIITILPRNQPMNQSTPRQSDQLKQHCFRARLRQCQPKICKIESFTLVQWLKINTTLAHTHATSVISFQSAFRSVFFFSLNNNEHFCDLQGTREAVNMLLFNHPRRAFQFPFVSCRAPWPRATRALLFQSVGWQRLVLLGLLLLTIARLPVSRLIRVDVQNVRRMFYGLLRNHSLAQVTQCSVMHEREGAQKIRGLYS